MPFNHLETRFWSKVDIREADECWSWKAAQCTGYGVFSLDSHSAIAHRVAFELSHHRKPKGPVLHRCENKICVNPRHLYEGDHVANARDLLVSGGGARRKLSNDDVREIRKLYKTGRYLQKELATRFGCTMGNIGCIVRGQTHIYVK